MWATGVQRELPFGFVLDVTYVGRLGRTCSGSATSISCSRARSQANPGVNIAALRPYLGYGAIRLAENAGRSMYQQPADQRRPAVRERLEDRRRVHVWQVTR